MNQSTDKQRQMFIVKIIILLLIIFGVLFVILNYFKKNEKEKNNLNSILKKNHFSPTNQSQRHILQPYSIVFLGDLMFDRGIRSRAEREEEGYDYFFSELEHVLTDADLVIGNLEGPITDNQSVSQGSEIGSRENFIFTFSPSILATLKKNNIQLVNLGNNHILNFGRSGLESTRNYLESSSISYFGYSGLEDQAENRIYFKNIFFSQKEPKQKDQIKLAFVNYNQFTEDGQEKVLIDLSYARNKSDLIVVYTHWGIEYEFEANVIIQNLAHKLIQKGADLVIGSHPHVIQQHEVYQGRHIYYSLGNTLFDQFFNQETKRGQLVFLEIQPEITQCLNFFKEPSNSSKEIEDIEQKKCSEMLKITAKKTQINTDGLIKIMKKDEKSD